MGWRLASKKDMPGVLEYLMREEELCVPFTSRLRAQARGCDVFLEHGGNGVSGCMLATATGLLLPALPADGAVDRDGLGGVVRGLRAPVHSVMGVGRCVQEIEALLPVSVTTRVEYFLMTLPRDAFRPAMAPQDERVVIRKADPADAELLFPLQKGYELEEVVIDPLHFSDAQCLKLLKKALREELVYAAEIDGRLAAKAATNARGYAVDQIGGVYTEPAERGRGLAKAVVCVLLREVFAEKRAACLFVKKRNRPAISLYERLGFRPLTDYVISYYGV